MRNDKRLVMACAMLMAFVVCAVAEEDPIVDGKPVSQWVQQLRNTNRGLQVRAAQALSKAEANQMPAIVPQLIPLLKSERENDRFVAAQTLGSYGLVARKAVPDLLPMLKGTQFERNRAAAAKALGQILKDAPPSDEVESVTDALIEKVTTNYDQFPDVRREAARALGMIGLAARKCISKLDKVLTEYGVGVPDTDYRTIRGAAAWTLGRMGVLSAEKMDYLISLMHKDLYRSTEYVEAMGCIGPVNDNVVPNIMDVIEMPQDGMRNVIEAYVALEKFGPKSAPAVPLLCRLLKEGRLSPAVTIQCVKILKAVGPAAAEAVPLLTSLGDKGVRDITPEQFVELKKCCAEAVATITGKK